MVKCKGFINLLQQSPTANTTLKLILTKYTQLRKRLMEKQQNNK